MVTADEYAVIATISAAKHSTFGPAQFDTLIKAVGATIGTS